MTPPLADHAARRSAVRSEANTSVTAGAGTGKTTLLVDTVLSKLLVDGLDVRRILMMTFTEKAANEMRLRLGTALRALLAEPARRAEWEAEGSDVEARLAAAIAGLDRAEVGTIHSFCAHVLREHPVEAGVDPNFSVDEGSRFDAMFAREWDRWLDEELGPEAKREAEWLAVLSKAKLADLRAVARGLCSFDVPEEALEAREGGAEMLARARSRLAARMEAAAAACSNAYSRLRRDLVEAAAWLKAPRGAPPFVSRRPSQDGRGWADPAAARELVEEAWRLARSVAAVDADLVGRATALVAAFAQRFRRAYTAEGHVSFDGLLAHVRRLLMTPEFVAVRDRLKARYDFILVDEFQDTDPQQCEILLFLAERAGDRAREAREVVLQPGKLFIVGDPKQSIYSFRGADIVAYGRLKRRIAEQGGREEVLRTNFRSHGGIIRAVNEIFARVIRPSDELQPAYERIEPEPGREPSMPSQRIELAVFGAVEGTISAEDSRRAEAAWIAKRLKRDLGAVEILEKGEKVPLAKRHVAILFRALTDVHLYLEALRAEDLQYVVEGEKYFYGTPEVIDAVNLLRAVADPHDRIAVAGVLRSPIGGVDDRGLYAMRKRLDYREAGAGEPGIFAVLRELNARSRELAVPDVVDLAFDRTCLAEIAAAGAHGEQAVANLAKIRQTARSAHAEGGATLRGFLKRLRESVREMEEEGESPLADETIDAIRVLSIHKAKGLEFPVVILPDLHRQGVPWEEGPAVRFDWPTYTLGVRLGPACDAGGAALAHHEARRRREESKRVFYVAMTRAREAMILTGSADWRLGSFLGLLEDALPGLRRARGAWRSGEAELHVTRETWVGGGLPPRKAREREKLEADWGAIRGAWEERVRERDRVLAARVFTSPTAMQAATLKQSGPAGPPAPFRAGPEDEEDAGRERAARLGILCHRVLQEMDFGKPQVAKLADALAEDPSLAEEAKMILGEFVKTEAFRRIARSKVLARELPFLLKDGETIVQGVIDLLVREPEGLVVVDYKSDEGGAAEEKKEAYGEQRRWYLRAVEEILGAKARFRLVFLRTGQELEG